MPEMTFEWALRKNNIDPNKDLTIDTSIDFAAMEGAFIGGIGDFVTLFEPNALNVEKSGYGYVVAFVGELGGNVPYTAYNAKKSYIENNPDIIKKFRNAINKALKFVYEENNETIAKSLLEFFPDTSLEDITKIINRYKEPKAWKENITINKEEWDHIQEIVISANQLDKKVDFNKLIYSKDFEKYE